MFDYFERRKRLREMEDAAIAEGRIPPGQSLTVKWPVLSAGPIPRFDPSTWTFTLSGLVDRPKEWTWDEFKELPRINSRSDIHCVTRWSKLDNEWEGIPVRDVLAQVKVDPRARYVMAHAPRYSANLPLEAVMRDDALFAFKHNGQDLEPQHGGPLRLVVPPLYFWKSVKWVNGLELMEEDRPGYWELRGYNMHGDPYKEERYGSWP